MNSRRVITRVLMRCTRFLAHRLPAGSGAGGPYASGSNFAAVTDERGAYCMSIRIGNNRMRAVAPEFARTLLSRRRGH